ncbi:MAG: hypothetical protein FWH08_05400 [Oscillospiraceae bacterium]|nr:hypothetical protein [Oscillospiraceae bacterium]
MGIEAAYANLSMNMSIASAESLISIRMLDKLLESEVQAAASLIADMKSMPPPVGAGDLGGLLDIKV